MTQIQYAKLYKETLCGQSLQSLEGEEILKIDFFKRLYYKLNSMLECMDHHKYV